MTAADPAPEPEPPAPQAAKVEITVAGHTVMVEGCESLSQLAQLAAQLIADTAGYAKYIPMGFSAPAPDITLAPPGMDDTAEVDGM